MLSIPVESNDDLWGGPDHRLTVVTRWADEDAEVMTRLLSDPTLQGLLLAAMRDVITPRPGAAVSPNGDLRRRVTGDCRRRQK